MEILLEYVIYALLGHNYEVGRRCIGLDGKTSQWMVTFEDNVRLVFDERDVRVLKFMVETSEDADTIARITKLLTYFV